MGGQPHAWVDFNPTSKLTLTPERGQRFWVQVSFYDNGNFLFFKVNSKLKDLQETMSSSPEHDFSVISINFEGPFWPSLDPDPQQPIYRPFFHL
jgi:hypothetical protein